MSLLGGVNGTFPFPCTNLNASPTPAQMMMSNTTNPIQQPNQAINNSIPAPVGLSSRAVGAGKRYRGVVVYYTTTKGFGFAHTEKPEMWKIYVHIYALEKCGVADLEVGMELEFNVRENHKGKYACNVCPVLRDASGNVVERDVIPVAIPMLEGRHRGTLKSFDSQRLFGWVMCGDTEVFMTIYELRHDNMEQHLVQGTVLEFTVGKHGRGLTAYDIEVAQTAAQQQQMAPQIQMAPRVALPLGSVASLVQSGAAGVQTLTPEQINALIAATFLNTQAFNFLSLTQQQPQIGMMNNNLQPNPNSILLQTQPSVVGGIAVGGGNDENAQMLNRNNSNGLLPIPLMGYTTPSPPVQQQQPPSSGVAPSSVPSVVAEPQHAREGGPLLRLPSMSTHSPLLDRTNRWEDVTMNGCDRKSSLSSFFEGCQAAVGTGSGLDASGWSTGLLN